MLTYIVNDSQYSWLRQQLLNLDFKEYDLIHGSNCGFQGNVSIIHISVAQKYFVYLKTYKHDYPIRINAREQHIPYYYIDWENLKPFNECYDDFLGDLVAEALLQ